MSKNAALKREQKKDNSLSVEREQGRPLGQPTNDKIQFSPRFTDFFHICLRTARNLTVVIVISFILSCYNLFICDRIMFIGCKSKNKIPYHQEKQRLFAKPSLIWQTLVAKAFLRSSLVAKMILQKQQLIWPFWCHFDSKMKYFRLFLQLISHFLLLFHFFS